MISVSNDDRLISTPVTVGDAAFVVQSWPGDEEWATFTADHLEVGVPRLEELIGSAWPVDDELAIRETVEPAFSGYAGWFDDRASEIAVGEELDSDTVFHELSHAWFNGNFFAERWLSEGFAETYAVEMVRRDGGNAREPRPIDIADPIRIPLQEWTAFDFGSEEVEDFAYPTSWFVVDAIVDDIGFDAMRDALATPPSTLLYGDPEDGGTSNADPIDWQRAYDLFEIVGGSSVVDRLFRDHVLDPRLHERLDDRAAARSAYDDFAAEAVPWAVPRAIRRDMDGWDFDEATDGMAEAREVLDRRAEVGAVAALTGVTPPDLAAEPFAEALDGYDEPLGILDRQLVAGTELVDLQGEIALRSEQVGVTLPALGSVVYDDAVEDFGDALDIGLDQLDALDAVAAAIDDESRTDDLLSRIGLLNTDVSATLDAASAALESGDTGTARELATQAQAVLVGADDTGRDRLLVGGGVVVGLLVAGASLLVLVRRRRSGRGAVDDVEVDEVGRGSVDLDEDALTRARVGGVDHRIDVAAGHPGEAAGAAGVVERAATLGDVRDPVLELDEDVGAVVDTDPVARTEVLIDPHAHDGTER